MYEISEGKFQPFPIMPGGRTEGFSFKKEFGRKEGKKLSRDLFNMLNFHPEIGEGDRSFVIPSSLAIFGKHNYGKKAEEEVKAGLSRVIEVPPKLRLEFKYNTIRPDELSLYEAAFGKYPLPEQARKKALSDTKDYFINDFYDGYTVTGAIYAQRHLSMGGDIFWPTEATELMLKKLQLAILEEWKKYQTTGVFSPKFASFALAYKVLRNST